MNTVIKLLLAADIILNLYLWCMTEPFRDWLWRIFSKTGLFFWTIVAKAANKSIGLYQKGWRVKKMVSVFLKEWHYCEHFGVELRIVEGRFKYIVKKRYLTDSGIEVREIVNNSLIAAISLTENPHGYVEEYDFEDIQCMCHIISGKKDNLNETKMRRGVGAALELYNTSFFDAIVSKYPEAQLRVLKALEDIKEDDSKLTASGNQDYRKFIRTC